MFKASDYKISPFELESVLIEHPAVAGEAAVVPAPDALRLAVPKAYVTLVAGHEPSRETALSILTHAREQLPPYLAGCGAWSSPHCPRPSRARSAGSSCAGFQEDDAVAAQTPREGEWRYERTSRRGSAAPAERAPGAAISGWGGPALVAWWTLPSNGRGTRVPR